MRELSDQVTRKFTESYTIDEWDIATDTGWQPITHLHKTIPYQRWVLTTETGKTLECADTHIVFTEHGEQCYVKDIIPGTTRIQTSAGSESVESVICQDTYESMFDLTVDSPDHRFYTNGILSHNSTILDALCFGLYGKPFRNINKGNLCNSINEKQLMVEVEFSTQNNRYLVRRGVKPTVFDIICNGQSIPSLPSTNEMQTYLEHYILRCNFKSFTSVVILGASSYVPFMRMAPQARREILEDVLDIQVFSTMHALLKERLGVAKERVAQITHTLEVIESQHALVKTYTDQWESRQHTLRQSIDGEIAHVTSVIEQLHTQQQDITKQLAVCQPVADRRVALQEKYTKASKMVTRFLTKRQHLQHSLEFFEQHDQCPMCTQPISGEFKQTQSATTRTQLDADTEQWTDAKLLVERLVAKIAVCDAAQQEVQRLTTQRLRVEEQLRARHEDIRRLHNDRAATLTPPPPPPTALENLEDARTAVQQAQYQKHVLEQGYSLLKDNGIRTKIIQHYLPAINQWVNYYLNALDFPIQFVLDEQFTETIKSRYRDEFSYENFSEGERRRIDLALILAWRAVAKLKNSVATNLIIFDEVFDSSLDSAGTEDFLTVLHKLGAETNVFVISHKVDSMQDKFSNVLIASKDRGFSVIAVQ